MGTSSYSSSLRNGGKPLRLAYPIHGQNTFRPSGNPETDPPEVPRESDLEQFRRVFGVDTPEGARAWDRRIADCRGITGFGSEQECDYWDRIRFLQMKSPRARKRAEERERRRIAKRNQAT
jgi:hypothetical protein